MGVGLGLQRRPGRLIVIVPVFVVLGAAENTKALENIYEGFEYGTISMRSFALR